MVLTSHPFPGPRGQLCASSHLWGSQGSRDQRTAVRSGKRESGCLGWKWPGEASV